jgi:deoxycytidine triphosphate deaminase
MTVLVDHEIEVLVGTVNLIEHFERSSPEGASYDMRLGERYVRAGEVKLLSDQAPTLVIQPGEAVILSSFEYINMPLNLIGHNGIMSPWAKRGMVSLFSPQIDPGFSGILIVPVFNAGDSPISITKHEKLFTVEFVRTESPASRGWSATHGRQDMMVAFNTPFVSRPNLADIAHIQQSVVDQRTEHDTLKTNIDTYRLEVLGNITALEEQFTNLKAELNVINNRLVDVISRRSFQLTLVAIVPFTIPAGFMGHHLQSYWAQTNTARPDC